MRIFFVGSIPNNDYDRTPEIESQRVKSNEALWKAAGELGKIAAERGHTIMVGSDRPTTIDHHVVRRGLLPVAKRLGEQRFYLEIYRPDDATRPFDSKLPTNVKGIWYIRRPGFPLDGKSVISGLKPGHRHETPLWLFAHQSAIASADAVIAMGGTDGTRNAVFTAENLNVPVLPIASFGGGAAEAYDSLSSRRLLSLYDGTGCKF